GELGGALLALLVMALRLVEQARVLERGGHRGGDGLEEPDRGPGELVLALVALHADLPDHAFAAQDRHEQDALARVGPGHGLDTGRLPFGAIAVVDRRARALHDSRGAAGPLLGRRNLQALAVLVDVEVV